MLLSSEAIGLNKWLAALDEVDVDGGFAVVEACNDLLDDAGLGVVADVAGVVAAAT